ncbi:MAG: hypothetical protein LBL21_04560 [Rickettsiales bacterium]|jgi:hypothetical protein|nr:hypothetical protein [Rickettsiales bacterium]
MTKTQFEPNLGLLKEWEDAGPIFDQYAYVAIFKKNEKTLIYACDDHGANVSFDMVDFCFTDGFSEKPQVAVIEYENSDRKMTQLAFQDNALAYAAGVAAKRGLPVVLADLSENEMLDVVKRFAPDKELVNYDYLYKILDAGEPSRKKGPYNLLDAELELHGRDPFMLKNIAAALNKFDTVFAIFGEGHYRSQRLVLEDMLGKPEYIKDFPNTRGDFGGLEFSPIKLV